MFYLKPFNNNVKEGTDAWIGSLEGSGMNKVTIVSKSHLQMVSDCLYKSQGYLKNTAQHYMLGFVVKASE